MTEEANGPAAPVTKRRVRKPAVKKKIKRVCWSAKREGMFLGELAQTSNVAASIRASGLSETSVYRRRQKSDEFRAAWTAALREGFAKLETMLLERALNGVEKAVWHGGKQVGTMREYPDRLALALLTAHRGSVTGSARGEAPPAVMSDAELRAELSKQLGEMNVRMGGAG